MSLIDKTKSVDSINKKSWLISIEDPEKSYILAEGAKDLSMEIDYKKGLADSLVNIAWYYLYSSQYIVSRELFIEAKKRFLLLNNSDGFLRCTTGLSASYTLLGDYPLCIENNVESIVYAKKVNNLKRLAAILTNSTQIYIKLNNPKRALEVALKAYKVSRTIRTNDQENSIYLKNIADAYILNGSYKKAKYCLKRSYFLSKESDFNQGVMECNCSLGIYSYKVNNFKKAKDYFDKVYNASQENYNREEMILEISNFYYSSGQYYEADKFLKEALELSLKNNTYNITLSCYELYIKLSLAKEDKESAERYIVKMKKGKALNRKSIEREKNTAADIINNLPTV